MTQGECKQETERAIDILVTLFVPSLIACFASSPGRIRRTEVCISLDEMVDFLLYEASSDKLGVSERADQIANKAYCLLHSQSSQTSH